MNDTPAGNVNAFGEKQTLYKNSPAIEYGQSDEPPGWGGIYSFLTGGSYCAQGKRGFSE